MPVSQANTIVCLASSRKNGGLCVAGKEKLQQGFGRWIRPMRMGDCSGLSPDDCRFGNGQTPGLWTS